MEKSSVEILKEIAKRADWEFEIKEQQQHFRAGFTVRNVIIKNNTIRDSYFISFQGDYFNKYRLYSGVFFPVEGLKNYNLLIKNRNVLDKMSFRKNRSRFKIGNSSFDVKLTVETNNDIETHKLLSSSNIQMEIMELMNQRVNLHIGFNEINPDFTKELEGKNYLTIFIPDEWMLNREIIEASFRLGGLLRNKFNQ